MEQVTPPKHKAGDCIFLLLPVYFEAATSLAFVMGMKLSGVRPFGVSLLVAGFDNYGPQLYQSMGANGSTGSEAVAAAEKNAALLTARAGSLDLSAIPSIFRVSVALQYSAETTMCVLSPSQVANGAFRTEF
uniref:Uncharacterized protein n=1 Tax=Quercus lobata TaxID=97700 RepID=A0A7N2QXQ0_QUELO